MPHTSCFFCKNQCLLKGFIDLKILLKSIGRFEHFLVHQSIFRFYSVCVPQSNEKFISVLNSKELKSPAL